MSGGGLVKRYHGNPILTRDDIPYRVSTVHNAGMATLNGRTIMLFRSHRTNGRSVIGIAESDDGFNFTSRPEPFLEPAPGGVFGLYEEYGVEDVRIAEIDQHYYLTYSAYSRHGVRIALAVTDDFVNVERLGLITHADYRNVVLFPHKFERGYARLDRPHSEISPWSIWIAWSPDMIHWGEAELVMRPVVYHWDEMKIGPGATPIRTDRGWLHIYHGVFPTMDGSVYRLGVALHDLKDPTHVLGVADDWILEPEDPWERVGYVHNVVFTCGAIPQEDGTVRIYWGGADTVMCVGTAVIDELVNLCLETGRDPITGSTEDGGRK